MTASILRRNLYPSSGSCGEHADYGLMTAIQTNAGGLQVWRRGAWRTVQWRRRGSSYIAIAGDMMDGLTSGAAPAALHRALLPAGGGGEEAAESIVPCPLLGRPL